MAAILLYDTTFLWIFYNDWHAGNPRYTDIAPLWASIQYFPLLWDVEQVLANQAGFLTLKP